MCLWLDILVIALIALVIFVTAMFVQIVWIFVKKRNGGQAQGPESRGDF